MILLVEEDKIASKKLCDILNQERIITVDSAQQVLEALVHHKTKLKVIVANARAISAITSKDLIVRLCEKIKIKMPPIIGLYRKGQEQLVKKLIENKNEQKFVKYDDKDTDFPSKYVKAIRDQYPDLRVDVDKVITGWTRVEKTQDIDDVRSWLKNEGFVEEKPRKVKDKKEGFAEKTPKKANEKKAAEAIDDKNVDYKKLYFEVKEKYDELLNYIHELTDTQ
jgi:hypothetical protein